MPDIRAIIFLLVILAIALWLGLLATDQAISGAGPRNTITDEQFNATATSDKLVTLRFSNINDTTYAVEPEVTVTDTQGNEFIADGNYTWFDNNGTILINGTGDLSNENTALIDYYYNTAISEGVGIADTMKLVLANARWLLFAVVGVLLLTMLAKVQGIT